jgi:hypothetical protein
MSMYGMTMYAHHGVCGFDETPGAHLYLSPPRINCSASLTLLPGNVTNFSQLVKMTHHMCTNLSIPERPMLSRVSLRASTWFLLLPSNSH